MALQQRLSLSPRLSQRLVLTPAMQQAIKLLQLSNIELAEYVEGELEQTLADGVVIEHDWIVRRTATSTTPLVPVSAVELTGRHMLVNVLAASAVGMYSLIATSRSSEWSRAR